jgi:hypothetical protein
MLTAKHAARDARKAMARVLRRKLGELDGGTFEKACVRMLHGLHFRELKVARRSKEGPTLTGRRKDGSLELRFAIRLLKGSQQVDRRVVQELRRELGNHGANLGLIVSAGEVRGDARGEGVGAGGLVLLWCADALAEKFFEAKAGVQVTQVELYEVDEAFFAQAQKDAEEAHQRREERHRERDQVRGGPDASAQPTPPMEGGSEPVPAFAAAPTETLEAPPADAAATGDDEEGDDEEGDDEGPEGEVAAEGGAGAQEPGAEGRRRRRRRRRRRGRGPRTDGAPGPAGAAPLTAAAPAAEGAAPVDAAPVDAAPVEVAPIIEGTPIVEADLVAAAPAELPPPPPPPSAPVPPGGGGGSSAA